MVTKEDLDKFAKSQDLNELEELLNEPNIFNILKIEKRETLHSNFLAWLLDPNGSHNLGEFFLKEFLKKAFEQSNNSQNIDSLNFTNALVKREDNHIDISILDDSNKWFIVIENKIYSKENGSQLNNYEEHAQKEYPNHLKKLIFLTATKTKPTNSKYTIISYDDIVTILKKLTKNKDYIKAKIYIVEYYKMLEMEFMEEESDIGKLTKQIYNQHKKAITHLFDFVNKQEVNDWIKNLLKKHNFILDNCKGKYYIRFIPKGMDFKEIRQGNPKNWPKWSDIDRIILFEFGINCDKNNKIYLSLIMGPGNKELRQKLYSLVRRNNQIFNPSGNLKDDFCALHDTFEIEKIDTKSITELEEEIEQKFNKFLNDSLPKIITAFEKEFTEKN